MVTTMFRAIVLAFSLTSILAQATPISTPDQARSQWATRALLSDSDFVGAVLSLEAKVASSLPNARVTDAVMPPSTPEPPTAALIGLAFCMFIILRRRWQK